MVRAKQRAGDDPIVEVIELSPALADLLARMRAVTGHDKTGPVFRAARGGAFNAGLLRNRAQKAARRPSGSAQGSGHNGPGVRPLEGSKEARDLSYAASATVAPKSPIGALSFGDRTKSSRTRRLTS
jgi:hypothetical protein